MKRWQAEVQQAITSLQNERTEDGLAALTIEEANRHQELLVTLDDLRLPIHRIEHQLQMQRTCFDGEKSDQILNWLSTIPYPEHHERKVLEVLPGTGQWFLTDSRLQEWQQLSSSSFLWLRGILGSGKSRLT